MISKRPTSGPSGRGSSKEELSDIFALPLLAARRALDGWLAYASRSKLAPFVRLARTIRHYRTSIEATIEWHLTNGIADHPVGLSPFDPRPDLFAFVRTQRMSWSLPPLVGLRVWFNGQ